LSIRAHGQAVFVSWPRQYPRVSPVRCGTPGSRANATQRRQMGYSEHRKRAPRKTL
jgi:hypothetical protein